MRLQFSLIHISGRNQLIHLSDICHFTLVPGITLASQLPYQNN